MAGNRVFDSLDEKRDFIQQRISFKYKRLLTFPEWSDKEIEEMSRTFRSLLTVWSKAKEITKKRLWWPNIEWDIDDADIDKILRAMGSSLKDKEWERVAKGKR